MKRIATAQLLLTLCIAGPAVNAQSIAQQPRGAPAAPASVIEQLLERPAPAPDWKRLPQPGPPGDTASAEEVLAFWVGSGRDRSAGRVEMDDGPKRPPLDDKIRGQLLTAVESQPKYLPAVLGALPKTKDAAARVKTIYDREFASPVKPDERELHNRWAGVVKSWLQQFGYFEEDLLTAAQAARGTEYGVEGEMQLHILAGLHWDKAQPLLQKNAAGADPKLALVSQSILFQHYLAAKDPAAEAQRANLAAVATDKKAGGFARFMAIAALADAPWDNKDQWLLGLFSDESLAEVKEGQFTIYRPLAMAVEQNPDYWIPRISPLVGNANRTIHDNAVTCLVAFHLERARADALKPLLPWLSNPKWSSAPDRLRLIQSLDQVDLPESVPGLMWVLKNEDGFAREGAVSALARYGAKEAGPALREAFAREKESLHERALVEGLLKSSELTDQEIAAAIEANARAMISPRNDDQDPMRPAATDVESKRATLGSYVTADARDRAGAAQMAVRRAREIMAAEPQVAEAMLWSLRKWTEPEIDRHLVKQLGRAMVPTLEALDRRELMRAAVGNELRDLLAKGGSSAGAAAAILGDAEKNTALLRAADTQAIEMLLACARLARDALPIDAVAVLLDSKSGHVAIAAERYLESEDSPAARKLVLARHPGEMRILGARMDFDPGHATYRKFDESEEALRRAMRQEGGPDEIFALLSEGYWGGAGNRIIEVRGKEMRLRMETRDSQSRERPLTQDELQEFRTWIDSHKINDLPPLNQSVFDGVQYEYVHLKKEGGRRVFMNNPGSGASAGTDYAQLSALFIRLSPQTDPGARGGNNRR